MEINITILLQLILFLFLLSWLSKFLFTPLIKLIDERERRIEGAKNEAIFISKKAYKYKCDIENKIYETKKKAKFDMAIIKSQGIERYRKVIDLAKNEARKKINIARISLLEEVNKTKQSLKNNTLNLTKEVLYKVLGEKSIAHKNDMEY